MPGAFVSVHFEGPSGVQLSICEAFVYTDQALPIERCPSFRGQPLGSTATYNGKCYIFYNDLALNFDDALETCRDRGGSLIDETNPALQGFLSWELWMRHRGDPNGQYWMGAIRNPEDATSWKWINGRDVTVSFWNLPGGDENCARFDGTKGWLWSDTNCMADLHFMCQHQPLTCGKPEQPPNSTMEPLVYVVGTEVEYKCDIGHVLIGPSKRTCLKSGFFDGVPPICRYIQCGHPASIRNGQYHLVNGTRHYGSQVQYECDPGYTMIDRSLLTCDDDKRWDGRPPRCRPNEALKPSLEDGDMDGSRISDHQTNRVDDSIAISSNGRPGTVIPSQQDNAVNEDLINNFGNIVDSPNYKGAGPAVDMGPKMQTGGIIALGVFGGVVLLSAIVTTIVILVKRSQNTSSKKYMRRHDDVTTSSDTSSSNSNGLNKYYKRAWDNLRDSSGDPVPTGRDVEKAHHHHHHRGEEGEFRSTRSGTTHEGLRDASEMTVNDVAAMYTRPEKRRHHHHHHSHRHERDANPEHRDRDWRDRRKY
ncbi:C-type lectin-like [Trinorchestia longiramus]|nr:C-type lectin-like [Trinorchestia longiramus]